MHTVVALFRQAGHARAAIDDLRAHGFASEEVSIIMRDPAEAAKVATEVGAGDSIAAGATSGGLLGGLAGLLAGAGLLVIPGLGPILAVGPLAAAVTGGAIGAATGGMIGVLVEQGISQEQARDYQNAVSDGAVMVAVRAPDGRESEARAVLDRHGAFQPVPA